MPEGPLGREMLSGGEEIVDAPGLDGLRRVYGYTPLGGGGSGVNVSVGVPSTSVFAAADRLLARKLAIIAAVTLLLLGIAWLAVDRLVVRPARRFSDIATRPADGDLRARTGLQHGPGELGQVAGAFDAMAQAREQAELGLLRSREQLEARVEQRTAELREAVARSNQLAEQARDASRAKSEFLAR